MPHPFHFIPLSPTPGPGTLPLDTFRAGESGNATHDRWIPGALHGRLICRMVLKQPCVFGNQHEQNPGLGVLVKPFELPGPGGGAEPAISATTLRGLLSSTAEAASLSSLRVLELNHPADAKQGKALNVGSLLRKLRADLLPAGNEGRMDLTAAELLFGFVEDGASAEGAAALALAGRVRFSHARLAAGQESPYFLSKPAWLEMMLGPNPRSARLYWSGSKGPSDSQSGLKPGFHFPQGHKRYLHHNKPLTREGGGNGAIVWKKTEAAVRDKSMHMRAKPLRPELIFWFHLDFDNLTTEELALLCYVIRPTDGFQHKLGLGKPLGLGSVSLDATGLFLLDRQRRLREPLGTSRWHSAWSADEGGEWPAAYEREVQAVFDTENTASPSARAAEFRNTMWKIAPEVISALERLGNPSAVSGPMRYFVPSSMPGMYLAPLEIPVGRSVLIPGTQPLPPPSL